MTFDADRILDRTRLKAQLAKWKFLAIVAIALFVSVVVSEGSQKSELTSDHIARVVVDKIILEDPYRLAMLEDLRKNPKVKAVIVTINSPGGTIVGGESLYRALRELSEEKPVVSVMGSLATSGGYMVALGTEHIVAHHGTVTGSIGVMLQTAQLTGLSEKLGVEFITLKSGEYKGSPSLFEPLAPHVREALQATIDDSYELFVDMVAESRSLDRKQVLQLADGRVFTGRQALEKKLVDVLGREKEALLWLKSEKKIDTDKLEVKTADINDYMPHMQKWYRWLEGYTGLIPSAYSAGIWAIWKM
jgi:protease-4